MDGLTGLFATPTAEVLPQGSARFSYSRFNPNPGLLRDVDGYSIAIGLLPGLEFGGRAVEANALRDLSLNLKYRIDLPYGAGLALGGTDFGGQAEHFRTRYAVATIPWQSLNFTAGFGTGTDSLDGAFGGVEWRPVRYAALSADHDTRDLNAGLKLNTGDLLGRQVQVGASTFWRGETQKVEYGVHLDVAFDGHHALPDLEPQRQDAARGATLIDTLRNLGFESIRTAVRGSAQVVALENRVYNHSSADGLAVALSAIAAQMAPGTETIELTLFAYGMPQVTVTTDRALSHFDVRNSEGYASEPDWDAGSVDGLRSAELVIEPLLRTFVATEFGVLDYGLALRPRLVVPLGTGTTFTVGAQLPVANSDDFKAGQYFEPYAPRAGLEPMLLQYAYKFTPGWSSLWSVGRSRIYQASLNTVASEHLWMSDRGTHQLRAKVMVMSAASRYDIALAGYTYFDPANAWSLSVSGGRYLYDSGTRIDFSRYFGDVISTLFLKFAGVHEAAIGMVFSLPLTPRRDAMPTGLQIKGSRRWSHNLATTVNRDDGANYLRPLFLYEPVLDLDLRRDFADSSRLGEAYLQQEIPRRLAQ